MLSFYIIAIVIVGLGVWNMNLRYNIRLMADYSQVVLNSMRATEEVVVMAGIAVHHTANYIEKAKELPETDRIVLAHALRNIEGQIRDNYGDKNTNNK